MQSTAWTERRISCERHLQIARRQRIIVFGPHPSIFYFKNLFKINAYGKKSCTIVNCRSGSDRGIAGPESAGCRYGYRRRRQSYRGRYDHGRGNDHGHHVGSGRKVRPRGTERCDALRLLHRIRDAADSRCGQESYRGRARGRRHLDRQRGRDRLRYGPQGRHGDRIGGSGQVRQTRKPSDEQRHGRPSGSGRRSSDLQLVGRGRRHVDDPPPRHGFALGRQRAADPARRRSDHDRHADGHEPERHRVDVRPEGRFGHLDLRFARLERRDLRHHEARRTRSGRMSR